MMRGKFMLCNSHVATRGYGTNTELVKYNENGLIILSLFWMFFYLVFPIVGVRLWFHDRV
jgi:hypothetical protein